MQKLSDAEYNYLERQIKPIYSLRDAVNEFATEEIEIKGNKGRSISIIDAGGNETCTYYDFTKDFWWDHKTNRGKNQIDYVKVKLGHSDKKETIHFLAEKKGLLNQRTKSKPKKENVKCFLNQCTGFNNTLNSAKFKAVRDFLNSIGITQKRINNNLIGFKEKGRYIPETNEFELDPRIVYPYWKNGEIVFWIARALPENVFKKVYPELDYFKTYNIKVTIDENGKEKWNWKKYIKLSVKHYEENGYHVVNNVPYNYDDINPFKDTIVICEGIPDSEALINQGINNLCISSTSGTNSQGWNKYIIPILKDIPNIIISGDNDEAGKMATVTWAKKLLDNKIFDFDFSVVPRSTLETRSITEVYENHFLTDKEVEEDELIPENSIKDIGEYLQTHKKIDYLDNNRINGFAYLALYYLSTEGHNARSKYIKEIVYPYKRFLQPYQIDIIIEDLNKLNTKDINITENDIKSIEKAFRSKPKESQVVNSILKNRALLHEKGVGFYEYEETSHIWQELDTYVVDGFINRELGEQFSEGKNFSSVQKHLIAEVHDPKPEFNQKDVLVFNNGTLYLNNGKHEFRENEFNPEDHVTFKCNYDFIEDADYSDWIEFLTEVLEVVDSDGIQDIDETNKKLVLAQEYIGYILHKDSLHGKKCLVLVGNSNNGKSVFMEVIKALFDEKVITNIPMQELGERFQTIGLKNSVLNISEETVEDLRDNKLKIFNSIVAGGTIRDSKKGLDVVEFRPRSKWIISGNNDFYIADKSNAVYNRLLYLDFPFTFTNDPEELKLDNRKKLDPYKKDKLMKNLSGIFLWALEGYERLIKNDFVFTIPNEHKREIEKLKTTNNPVREFIVDSNILDQLIEVRGQKVIHKDITFKKFQTFSSDRDRNSKYSYQRFIEEFSRQLNDLGVKFKADKIRIDGKRPQVFIIYSIPENLLEHNVDINQTNKPFDHLEIL